jgi:hypothetical protein
VSADNRQRALVDESGMNITQMGKHNRSEIVAVYGTPWAIQPRNSNICAVFVAAEHNILPQVMEGFFCKLVKKN